MKKRFLTLWAAVGMLQSGDAASETRFSAWSAPINIGAPINTPAAELTPEISRDRSSLYFSRQLADGTLDLMVSKWDAVEGVWGEPEPLEVLNSPASDVAPTLSRDGHSMYFGSTRPGGCGGYDVWVSRRRNGREDFGNGGWRTPEHLGCTLNTPSLDAPNAYVEDEDTGIATLWVTHAPDPAAASITDICVSDRAADDEPFGPCVPVAELSTEFRDARVTFRRDGLEAFLESARPETAIDLWVTTRESDCEPWSPPVNLGAAVNAVCPQSATCNDQAPRLSFDGTALYFTSNRPGGAGNDIYVMTRTRIPAEEK